jgi:hypothetical protein
MNYCGFFGVKLTENKDIYELQTFIDVSNDPEASKSPYG